MAMGGGIGRITKHPDYYLPDGSISFLTRENIHFRVHKSFFERESEFFRNEFAEAAQEDPSLGTEALPFKLDVTADDFALLLWVWYDRDYAYNQQTKDGWNTILHLSILWGFDKIKELAVRELDALQLSPAERISIYNKHGVEGDRLVSSYVELCKSPKITKADGELLEMETLINVFQAREDAQREARRKGRQSPTSASLEDDDLRGIVSKFFKTGLSARSNGTTTGSGAQASDLNGEHTYGNAARTSTITIGEPQVPGRKAQLSSEPPTRMNDLSQTQSEEVINHPERGKGKGVGKDGAQEKMKENATMDKENGEKGQQEKGRQVNEKEDKVKTAMGKLKKEEPAKVKETKVDQKPLARSRS